MSFLFPLYLLGALAVGIPIFLHLRRRPPKEHIEFGSLMFLEKTPERVTRRTRLEQILLLALRCLALILLALAFGRPFLSAIQLPSEKSHLTRAVVLLDRSASMRRGDLHQAAIAAATDAARGYEGEVELALAVFDEKFTLLADLPTLADLGSGARAAAVSERLTKEDAALSWLGTDLGLAMTQAASLLLTADAERPAQRREIVVISDFQSGATRELLRANPWSAEVKVRCLPVAPAEKGNLSLTLAATPPRSDIDEAEVYRVRITSAAETGEAKIRFGWKGFPETYEETLVAPGTGRIVRSTPRPAGAERGTIEVTGDAHPFDNEVHVAPVQPRPLRLRYLGDEAEGGSAGSPLFYLKKALQPTLALLPMVTATPTSVGLDPNATEIVVAPGSWDVWTGEALHHFASTGGLVIALPDAKLDADAFAALTGQGEWKLSEASVKDYAMLADLDFEHPVLEPFARAQIRDFTKVRFWKHRTLDFGNAVPDDSVRILAKFDSGSPAWMEQRIGDGAAFYFFAGWRPEEGQLALSSKFVPLLFSIFDHAGYSIRAAPAVYVGETDKPAPGFYETTAETGEKRLLAVNLDPSEGRTDPFDPLVEFAALGIPLSEATPAPAPELSAAQKLRVESEQKESRQKLWKWLVLAALAVLVAETWLAGRGSRFKAASSKLEPASSMP